MIGGISHSCDFIFLCKPSLPKAPKIKHLQMVVASHAKSAEPPSLELFLLPPPDSEPPLFCARDAPFQTGQLSFVISLRVCTG